MSPSDLSRDCGDRHSCNTPDQAWRVGRRRPAAPGLGEVLCDGEESCSTDLHFNK